MESTNGPCSSLPESGERVPRKTRKIAALAFVFALALVGSFALCPVGNMLVRPVLSNFDSRYVSGWVEPISFDRELWMTGKATHRVGMAKHLTESKALELKARAELVGMLGEPDSDKPDHEGMRWLLDYRAKGLFDESIWLEPTIRADGRATGAIVGMSWYDPR